MNVTLQTNNFNPKYGYNQNQFVKNNKQRNLPISQPSFTGVADLPGKSGFLKPITNLFDKFTSFIQKHYTDKLYTSWFAEKLAAKSDKLDSVVDKMSILGSIIISGMYMTQTLRNKQLDEDRKRTLAINQGLTFGLATLGSVVIDQSLDNWWEKQTVKYAQSRTGDHELGKKIDALNNKAIKEAEEKLGKAWKDFTKKDKKGVKLTNTLKYVEEYMDNEPLEIKLKGMGVLKKLIIFGTVYRFLSPVLITPFANMIGNKLAESKNSKAQ
ncbi:hypothetical protein IJ541_11030 [bacterium]|nr:hypothetical protein [bacterium]